MDKSFAEVWSEAQKARSQYLVSIIMDVLSTLRGRGKARERHSDAHVEHGGLAKIGVSSPPGATGVLVTLKRVDMINNPSGGFCSPGATFALGDSAANTNDTLGFGATTPVGGKAGVLNIQH